MDSGSFIGFLCSLLCVYVFGGFISVSVLRARAGLGVWAPLPLAEVGLGWVANSAAVSMVWPIAVVVWLARGRPEPRVVFFEKARERQRRETLRSSELTKE